MTEESEKPAPLLATISIPFESERQANIVAKSLLVDLQHEGARMSSGISKDISHSNNELVIKFTTASAKSLRVNVNSILDLVTLLIDTVDNFDIEAASSATLNPLHDGRQQ